MTLGDSFGKKTDYRHDKKRAEESDEPANTVYYPNSGYGGWFYFSGRYFVATFDGQVAGFITHATFSRGG